MRPRPWWFHPAALVEVDDAGDRYAEEREGPDDDSLEAVETLLHVGRSPGAQGE